MARLAVRHRHGRHTCLRVSALPLLIATALAPQVRAAARLDYTLGASALHSDNIGLDPVTAQSDTVLAPSLGFSLRQAGSVLQATVLGNVQYLDYLDNTYSDQLRGAFSGQAAWTVVPQRLQFVAEDYLSRQPVDSFAAFSPSNQQQTNVFVAGPTIFGQIGVNLAQLDLRYANSHAENRSAFDSDRYSAAWSVQRELSPTRSLSGAVQYTKVDYADGSSADYTRNDAYATYDTTLRVVDLKIDAGYSRLAFADGRADASGPLLRLAMEWRPAPRSVFTGRLDYQFSDAVQTLRAQPGADPSLPLQTVLGSAQVPIQPDVYRERRVEIGYRYEGVRLKVSLAPYYQRIHYVDTVVQDQNGSGGVVTLDYQLRQRTSLAFLGAVQSTDYSIVSRRDTDALASVGLVQQFNRHWSGRVDLQHRRRSSSAAGQGYDENAATLSVSYHR